MFEIYDTLDLNIHGIEYIPGSIIMVEWNEYSLPLFGKINKMYVRDDVKYFLLNMLETQEYVWEYHSYLVLHTDQLRLLKWNNLNNKFPLDVRRQGNRHFVMNKYGQLSGSYDQED